LDVLLSRDVYKASFKRALDSGGMDASAQSLNDLTGLRQFLTGNGLFAFFDAPWLPIYVAVMFMFHPWYGWVAIGSAIVLLILAYFNERFTGGALGQANKENIAATLYTTKNLRNAEVIESMGMLNTLIERWSRRQRNVLLLQSVASDKGGIISSISKTFRMLIQSLILGLGAYLAVNHEISPGLVIAGSVLLGRALAPIDLIIGSWKGFIAARSQYNRLNDILDKQKAEPERMSLPVPQGHILVENLVVGAPGSKTPIIRSISFGVPAGAVVGIIGPSASGKSTLARAIYGTPRLILLDEPNSNLDEVGERALATAILELKQTGATIFVITHRTTILSQLDRLLVMSGGGISMYGPRDQVMEELNKQQIAAQQKAQVGTGATARA
jgi:ATP-binding cassette subfamily C protein EexD